MALDSMAVEDIIKPAPTLVYGAADDVQHLADFETDLAAQVLDQIRVLREGGRKPHHVASDMRRIVARIPGFHEFSWLCRKDMHRASAVAEGDGQPGVRRALAVWRRLFAHFAQARGITQELRLYATTATGDFRCELVEPMTPSGWERFFREGRALGVAHGELMAIYRKRFTGRRQEREGRLA